MSFSPTHRSKQLIIFDILLLVYITHITKLIFTESPSAAAPDRQVVQAAQELELPSGKVAELIQLKFLFLFVCFLNELNN